MREVYSVAQVATYIRELLETDVHLADLWVEGEVSNLARSAAGHTYFTLKDESAQLRCVMFRRQHAGTPLEDGTQVTAHGRISFFERRGELQLNVDFVQPAGVGIWQAQLERLKAQLEEEGLFEPSRKRPIPSFPRRIGVVTSPTGAVFHDICNIIGRRWPLTEIVLAPTPVQGDEAAPTIVEALSRLNDEPDIDVIIVARGGGSLEELWAFNDERVARAIVASRVPVISGVGHEVDLTIADFAADVRAPTPSAAAELAVPDRAELQAGVRARRMRLAGALQEGLAERQQSLHYLRQDLRRASPLDRVQSLRQRVDELSQASGLQLRHLLALRRERLNGLAGKLATLSPFATLERGYAIVRHAGTGRVVSSVAQVAADDPILVRLQDGEFEATVG